MDISQEKIDNYRKLVEEINTYGLEKLKGTGLTRCKNCKEVNLWSYWQGGESHLNAELLLVGQDWGSTDYADEYMKRITKESSLEAGSFCYMEDNNNTTNLNICELMKSIYNVDLKMDRNIQTQLFFTNYVPWYREKGKKISGDYKKSWEEPSKKFFCELVEIIKPKVVLCLGQKTYNNVCNALKIPEAKKGKSYSEIIERGYQNAAVKGTNVKVFPLAHPGYWGTRNRNLEKQMSDWKRVKDVL